MTMNATVIRVNPGSLLVRDERNNQEVLVHFRNANQFRPGDRVRITFNGQMTMSIPPQIAATSIQRVSGASQPGGTPARVRALVLQIGRGFLMAWDLQENRLLHVEFANAQRFRVGQQVVINYETIFMDNPPRIVATSITPA